MNQLKIDVGPHRRSPWGDSDPKTILVAAPYTAVKGTAPGDRGSNKAAAAIYERAKRQNNADAAAQLVAEHFSDRVIDLVVDALESYFRANKEVFIVHPHPCFNDEDTNPNVSPITNALPVACAALLADVLGATICDTIIQVNRPGRTALNATQRFLYQARFNGHVKPGAVYVLVDDNCTMAGTLAMLRTHIVDNGGTVGAVCVLCSPEGLDMRFPIANSTLDVVLSEYSHEIDAYWLKEVGHEVSKLTEPEGSVLRRWAEHGSGPQNLQHLRTRIDKARANAEHR